MVKIEPAGMGVKQIRLANLPPDVPDRKIREMLTMFVGVKDKFEAAW
jgi:hypothetical protein